MKLEFLLKKILKKWNWHKGIKNNIRKNPRKQFLANINPKNKNQ